MIAPGKNKQGEQSETRPDDWHAMQEQTPRSVHRFVWAFGTFMVVVAAGGFLFKLYEFFHAFLGDHPMNFSLIPVMTYLIVAAGFGCLFMWAYLSGQYKNIEGPKYRMLEMQQEIDEAEREAAKA